MRPIYKNLTELIGNTPLIELGAFSKSQGLTIPIIAKLEMFNPGSSVKDRVALAMIEAAERNGDLKKDTVIIEPTSGNTGIGLAMVASIKKYRIILTMPETMSLERQNMLKALGAELHLTPGKEGMSGAIRRAEKLHQEIKNSFIPQQFNNPENYRMHLKTTSREIWEDTDGKIDIFVAGVGTGGTISGVAEGLKEKNPAIEVYAVEPISSAVLSGEAPGSHKIQGIGAGFIPQNFHKEVINGVIKVADNDAVKTSRLLAQTEGLLVGISSGAAAYAARLLAQKPENKGKKIVVVLPDSGERYLSTLLYAFEDYPL